jgi:error-prone DNA polymerase
MYPRRMILDECRLFGVAVLPPDVNRSVGPYTVEVVDRGLADHLLGLTPAVRAVQRARIRRGCCRPGGGGTCRRGGCRPRPATAGELRAERPTPDRVRRGGGRRRLPLRGPDRAAGRPGITDEEVAALLAGRPFTSLTDLRERGGCRGRPPSRSPTWGRWTSSPGSAGGGAGVDDGRCAGGRGAVAGPSSPATWGGDGGQHAEQAALDLHADHVLDLPEDRLSDRVRAELADHRAGPQTRHVVSFYEPLLEVLEVTRACDLTSVPTQTRVRVAGVKVAVQSPAQRSGQRVLFLSLDDRTGHDPDHLLRAQPRRLRLDGAARLAAGRGGTPHTAGEDGRDGDRHPSLGPVAAVAGMAGRLARRGPG